MDGEGNDPIDNNQPDGQPDNGQMPDAQPDQMPEGMDNDGMDPNMNDMNDG